MSAAAEASDAVVGVAGDGVAVVGAGDAGDDPTGDGGGAGVHAARTNASAKARRRAFTGASDARAEPYLPEFAGRIRHLDHLPERRIVRAMLRAPSGQNGPDSGVRIVG